MMTSDYIVSCREYCTMMMMMMMMMWWCDDDILLYLYIYMCTQSDYKCVCVAVFHNVTSWIRPQATNSSLRSAASLWGGCLKPIRKCSVWSLAKAWRGWEFLRMCIQHHPTNGEDGMLTNEEKKFAAQMTDVSFWSFDKVSNTPAFWWLNG